MKRTFSAILCAMLLMGTMTACGGGGNESSAAANNGGDGTSANAEAELPESIDVSIYMPIFNETPPETTLVGQIWTEMMEDYLGVQLNIDWQEVAYSDYLQKMSIYLAAGDWADVFTYTGTGVTKDQLMEYGQTGMVLCLDDYADYTPNLNKYYGEGNNRKNTECSDGKVYFMPGLGISPYTGGGQCCFAIRWDAYEANGMDVPQTLDDVYEDAKKFKELYPNSYPVSTTRDLLTMMYSLNNTSNQIYYDGEKYAYGPTDGGKLKGIVEWLAKMYAEGLLDPEYATQTGEMLYEKCLNDKAFISPWLYALEITDNINAASGDVEWAEIPMPTGTEGDTPWIVWPLREGNTLDGGTGIAINAKTEYPELMVKMLDYQLSDEMIELCTWGVEGETFTLDENGEHQYIEEISSAANPQTVMAEYGLYGSMACRPGIAFMPDSKGNYFQIFPKMPSWNGTELINVNSWEFFTMMHDAGINVAAPEAPSISFTVDESAQMSETMTTVNTFVDENIAKFIAGERPMSEWDAFVDEIAGYGDYQSILDMYNQKLEEFNAE